MPDAPIQPVARSSGHHKIIFAGPVGAGKTTAIASLSDTPVVCTDEAASDMTRHRKSHTTVALDYGTLKLPGGEKVHLYGSPGQERFDFMWDILTEGGIGLVLLLDNSRHNPFHDLGFFLKAFGNFIRRTHAVIGVSHCELKSRPTLDEHQAELQKLGFPMLPVFEVDPRRRDDVALLVETLIYCLDPETEPYHA